MRFLRFVSLALITLIFTGVSGFSASIHSAVRAGDSDNITAELTKDANAINQPDVNGKPPLHLAVEKNDAKLVGLIISKGADVSIKDRSGKTPLRIAIDADSVACVNLLITKTPVAYVDPLLDTRLKDGFDALKDGSIAKLNEMLGKIIRLDPTSENINFAYGLTWLSLGDPASAGTALESVLLINPKNDRARVELARARIAANRYPEARTELEKVLTSDLPADVKASVENVLKNVKHGMTRWYYSGHVQAGGLYDNNANVGPDSDVINIMPVNILGMRLSRVMLSDSSRPNDTSGFYLSAKAGALYDIGARRGWFLTTDGNGYCNWLQESDYDTISVQAGLGLKRIFNRGVLEMPFRARYIEYSGDPLVWVYGFYPAFTYTPASMNHISFTTRSSVERREFDTLGDRDSAYVSLGEVVRKTFAYGKYSLYGGVDVQHDHADAAEYEYTGAGLMAGGDAKLPWRLSLFGEARYGYRNYKGRNILAPKDRCDDQYTFAAGISRSIFKRFSVSLTHTIIDNDSSFDLYEYKRQITTISTSLKF